MSVRYPIFALLLLAATSAEAQDSPSNSASTLPQNLPVQRETSTSEPEVLLETLLQLAQQNNPQPQIARANLEAARQRAKALGSLPSPVLQIVPGIGGTRESRDEEVILSQPIDLFGSRRAQHNVASAEARRAEADATLTERTLVVEVKNSAANLFAAQEAESLGSSQVSIATAFRDAAARKAQLGDVPAVQVQRAELELSRAQNELENARTERLARRAILNQLVGQAPETPFRVALPSSPVLTELLRATAPVGVTAPNGIGTYPTVDIYAEPEKVGTLSQIGPDLGLNRSQILPQALSNRPDIIGAQATLEARQANVNAISRSRYPQFEIQARRNGVFDSPVSTSLRAVVTVPLFDFGDLKGQKKAAEAQVRAQEAEISLLKSQVAAQVESSLVRLNQQRATVQRYRTSIVPQTLDLLRKTQVGYVQGASTYLEVLEAQRATRQVQTEYLQALVGVRTSEAALESAYGGALPTDFNGVPTPTTGNTSPSAETPITPNSDNLPSRPIAPNMFQIPQTWNRGGMAR